MSNDTADTIPQTTTLAAAIDGLEIADIRATREEVELCSEPTAHVYTTDDRVLAVVDGTGQPVSREVALAEIDARLAELDA